MLNLSPATSLTSTIKDVQTEFQQRFEFFFEKAFGAIERNHKLKARADAADFQMLETLAGTTNAQPCLVRSNVNACSFLVGRLIFEFAHLARIKPKFQYHHVTIIHDGWATSDQITQIKLARMKKDCRRVLAAMSKHYIAVAELQAFSNLRHADGGQTLSLHTHAIVFGKDIGASVAAAKAAFSSRFTCTIENCEPIVAERIRDTLLDLVRVIRYPLKGHDRCKNRYVRPDGTTDINESEKPDRLIRYLRMFQLLSMLPLNSLIFSGGKHAGRMRSHALKETQLWAENLTAGEPPLRLDEIQAFWMSFIARIGEPRFKSPLLA